MAKVSYCYQSFTSELKVWGERSPLSNWSEVIIAQKLKFQIVFNRSEFAVIKPLVIRGDQSQLEHLIAGIVAYVDRLLNSQIQNSGIKLWHRCFIPNLPDFSKLEFSTLELCDLLTNLECLTNEVEILPSFESVLEVKHINSAWLKAAAAITTVGLATSIRFLLPEPPKLVVSSNPPQTTPNSLQKPLSQKKSPEKLSEKLGNLSQPAPKTNIPNRSSIEPKLLIPKLETKLEQRTEELNNLSNSSQSQPKSQSKSLKTKNPQPQLLIPSVKAPNSALPKVSIAKSPQVSEQPSILSDSVSNLGSSLGETEGSKSANTPAPMINPTTKGLPDSERLRQPAKPTLPSAPTTIQPAIRGDRRNNALSSLQDAQDKNLKIQVIKILGSVSPQVLNSYRQKIESLALPKLSEEIEIEVRWQNRQITEIKIQPETPELREFIQRSLLEAFSNQDGSIEITLKVTFP